MPRVDFYAAPSLLDLALLHLLLLFLFLFLSFSSFSSSTLPLSLLLLHVLLLLFLHLQRPIFSSQSISFFLLTLCLLLLLPLNLLHKSADFCNFRRRSGYHKRLLVKDLLQLLGGSVLKINCTQIKKIRGQSDLFFLVGRILCWGKSIFLSLFVSPFSSVFAPYTITN